MTLKNGTHVTWDYRGATGHGTIVGVHKPGKTEAETEYSIQEHDHHVSATGSKEAAVVHHYGSDIHVVSKADLSESRYVLGIAYQAGKDPRIRTGADGHRDYFAPDELEKAAWSFLRGPGEIGIYHVDGTVGHAQVVESYIYRGPQWQIGDGVVKSGDWLVGAVCDDVAWDLVKTGRVTGFSPQGAAKRRPGRSTTDE